MGFLERMKGPTNDTNTASGVAGLAAAIAESTGSGIPQAGPVGGVAGVLGGVTGIMQMLDSTNSTHDRVVGGLNGVAGASSLASMLGWAPAAAGGAEVTAASFGLGSQVATGTLFGTGGALLGAGLAGYGMGQVIQAASDSQGSRDSGWFGQDEWTGEDRSYSDWVADSSVDVGNWVDDAIGGEAGGFRDRIGHRMGQAAGLATTVAGTCTIPGWIAGGASHATSWFD